MDKDEKMAQLRREAEAVYTDVCDPDSTLVWGEGDLDACLVIVGEAPGKTEDELGRPFVGPSGRFLDSELRDAGIARENVYITGVLKCRPTTPGRNANRAPSQREVNAWLPILLRQIEIISPGILLCLGATAASALIHPAFRLTKERGIWFDGPFGTRSLATYHPAYVMRWKGKAGSERLREFRADLRTVAQVMSCLAQHPNQTLKKGSQ